MKWSLWWLVTAKANWSYSKEDERLQPAIHIHQNDFELRDWLTKDNGEVERGQTYKKNVILGKRKIFKCWLSFYFIEIESTQNSSTHGNGKMKIIPNTKLRWWININEIKT